MTFQFCLWIVLLIQRIFNISKRHLQKLALALEKEIRAYINFGNDETQSQKVLIPTQKPKHFDHKRYKGRRILKFEFIFTINDGDSDARWSMSFYLPTCKDNLLGKNQAKYLIRPIIMTIRITRIKNKTRKSAPSLIINSLMHVCVSEGNNFFYFCSYFIKENS